jgi:hypothetical protein
MPFGNVGKEKVDSTYKIRANRGQRFETLSVSLIQRSRFIPGLLGNMQIQLLYQSLQVDSLRLSAEMVQNSLGVEVGVFIVARHFLHRSYAASASVCWPSFEVSLTGSESLDIQ